jgi:predicted phosphohydrolase
MTLHYASDLHLEFPENREWLRRKPLRGEGGVLLLAGDVMPFGQIDKHKDLLKRWGQQYGQVLWIPGNHEYYGEDIAQRSGTVDEAIVPGVRLLNNTAVQLPGLRILCTTLWSPIGQLNEAAIRRGMTDYHVIRQGNGLLHPAHITALHHASLAWLQAELATPFAGHTVVATHHVPTLRHYPPEYLGNALNEAFAVDLDELIAGSGATAWIHGHHHRNTPPFRIAATQVLTNQLGYVRVGEERGFDPGAMILLQQQPAEQPTP